MWCNRASKLPKKGARVAARMLTVVKRPNLRLVSSFSLVFAGRWGIKTQEKPLYCCMANKIIDLHPELRENLEMYANEHTLESARIEGIDAEVGLDGNFRIHNRNLRKVAEPKVDYSRPRQTN